MLRDSFRLLVILNTLLKARLDKELSAFEKPKIISLLLLISPWRLYSSKGDSGERLRKALEDLGPIFIKFGQLLSTRPDVLPTEITSSLKTLQDDLPHFSETEALALIEKELGSSIDILIKNKSQLLSNVLKKTFKSSQVAKYSAIFLSSEFNKPIINEDFCIIKSYYNKVLETIVVIELTVLIWYLINK